MNEIMRGASMRGKRARTPNGDFDLTTEHGRLAFKRSQKYPSASAAARAQNIPIPTMNQLENGTRKLTLQFALQFANEYGTTLDFLLRGIGVETELEGHDAGLDLQIIPLIDLGDIVAVEKFEKEKNVMSNKHRGEDGGNPRTAFVEMPDNAMEDATGTEPIHFRKGDKIQCAAGVEVQPGDFVLAIVEGDPPSALIRRFRLVSEKPFVFELVPLNKYHAKILIDNKARKGRIIARVQGLLTRF